MPNDLPEFLQAHALPANYEAVARQQFEPVVQHLASAGANKGPIFLGINGCQGSGKSTLAAYFAHRLWHQYNCRTAVISLDDFYFDAKTRNELARRVHPLLQTRGVPGTHDTEALRQCLQALQLGQPLLLPRFNKAIDNPFPKTSWDQIDRNVDVVIVEGWCWGTPAQPSAALNSAVNRLEREQDTQKIWRTYVNEQLRQHYQPLYPNMDVWLMLKAPSFSVVADWRKQQEHKLKVQPTTDKQGVKFGMTDSEIETFVLHYQRLTEHSLLTVPAQCNWVFSLDAHRNIIDAPTCL